jgi:hypothetical protein
MRFFSLPGLRSAHSGLWCSFVLQQAAAAVHRHPHAI